MNFLHRVINSKLMICILCIFIHINLNFNLKKKSYIWLSYSGNYALLKEKTTQERIKVAYIIFLLL